MSKPGFRFSITDAIFIAVLAIAFAFLWKPLGPVVWVIPFAAGHFFLFCNVFRVRRSYELAWVAVFFVIIGVCFAIERFSWPVVFVAQTPFTIAAIALEVASPRYHGIFCRPSE